MAARGGKKTAGPRAGVFEYNTEEGRVEKGLLVQRALRNADRDCRGGDHGDQQTSQQQTPDCKRLATTRSRIEAMGLLDVGAAEHREHLPCHWNPRLDGDHYEPFCQNLKCEKSHPENRSEIGIIAASNQAEGVTPAAERPRLSGVPARRVGQPTATAHGLHP